MFDTNAQFYATIAHTELSRTFTNAATAIERRDTAARLLHTAYQRYTKHIDRCGCNFVDKILDMAAFATRRVAPALVYDIGEIVQIVRDGVPHYGTVTKYAGTPGESHNVIEVSSDDPVAHGNWKVSTGNPAEFKARIPANLLNLIRSQLMANCPLKEATCH